MDEPTLVEPTTKHFLTDFLRKTHEQKMTQHKFILNCVIGAAFFLIVGGFLLYRYRTKPTPIEKALKMERDQAVILSKIQQYQDTRKRGNYSSISSLPCESDQFVDLQYYLANNGR